MEELNKYTNNLAVLIDNTPLTVPQREELVKGLKFLYEKAKKWLEPVEPVKEEN